MQPASFQFRRARLDADWRSIAAPAKAAESSSLAGSAANLPPPAATPIPQARQAPLPLPTDSPPVPAADESSDSSEKRNTPTPRRWCLDWQPPTCWLFHPNRPALDAPARQTICDAAPDRQGSQSSHPTAQIG